MTMRKLMLLYVEYLKEHGQYQESLTLDEAIPEGVI